VVTDPLELCRARRSLASACGTLRARSAQLGRSAVLEPALVVDARADLLRNLGVGHDARHDVAKRLELGRRRAVLLDALHRFY
jgi:hypothetical protein